MLIRIPEYKTNIISALRLIDVIIQLMFDELELMNSFRPVYLHYNITAEPYRQRGSKGKTHKRSVVKVTRLLSES